MDLTPLHTANPTAWTERFVAMLHSQRTRVREFLVARQTRIEGSIALLEELIQRLSTELENQPAAGVPTGNAEAAEATEGEFERRYGFAMDDLRELKAKNAELQQQLARTKTSVSTISGGSAVVGTSQDWESLKRSILAALESDVDENDPSQKAERLKIQDIIRITDSAIAEKNREINELKRQLKDASEMKAAASVETAATAQLFDADTAIQAERERLRQLQEQWKDKMRQAEIEVSLERAKLTRQRAEIEERLRTAESDAASSASQPAEKPTQPVRRWRVRLGLGDPE